MLLRNIENFTYMPLAKLGRLAFYPPVIRTLIFLLLEQLIPRQAAAAGPEQARVAQAVFFKKPRGRLNQIYTT